MNKIKIEGINPQMIANNIIPSTSTHPGEIIAEELEARGETQVSLAQKIDMPVSQLNEIIHGKRDISTETALLLEAALGIEAEFWMAMQNRYSMQRARSNKTFLERLARVRQIVAAL